jgi:hypothetical protein
MAVQSMVAPLTTTETKSCGIVPEQDDRMRPVMWGRGVAINHHEKLVWLDCWRRLEREFGLRPLRTKEICR